VPRRVLPSPSASRRPVLCRADAARPGFGGYLNPGALETNRPAVAAVPGYVLAIIRLDRIGHRKLQLTGFAVMALCFLVIAARVRPNPVVSHSPLTDW
jgi:Sugar (and other) transporter